jgi:hypothetical protein
VGTNPYDSPDAYDSPDPYDWGPSPNGLGISGGVGVPLLVDGTPWKIRHIGPSQIPDTGTLVLGTYMTGTPLEIVRVGQARLAQGTLTRRLSDSSEGSSITLPGRFSELQTIIQGIDPNDQLHWFEVYRGDLLRDVWCVIGDEKAADHVKYTGANALELLKKVYEQGRTFQHAPKDVIEVCSRARQMVYCEDSSNPFPQWYASVDPLNAGNPITNDTYQQGYGQNITFNGSSGFVVVSTQGNNGSSFETLGSVPLDLSGMTDPHHWRASVTINNLIPSNAGYGATTTLIWRADYANRTSEPSDIVCSMQVDIPEPSPTPATTAPVSPYSVWETAAGGGPTTYPVGMGTVAQGQTAANWPNGPVTLTLERQGRWMRGFVNGVPLPEKEVDRDFTPTTFVLIGQITGSSNPTGSVCSMVVEQITVMSLKPFCMQNPNAMGDVVLPGAYPPGGLSVYLWQNADLSGLASADFFRLVNSPNRLTIPANPVTQIDPGPSGFSAAKPTFGNPGVITTPGYTAGAASARWFGSVYLKASQIPLNGPILMEFLFASITGQTDGVPGNGFRCWIGNTLMGTQVVDTWYQTSASSTQSFSLTQAEIGDVDGWFPVVIEYASYPTSATQAWGGGFTWYINTPGSGSYTDPGGSVMNYGSAYTVPATSLSPLGIYESTVSGQSHYQTIQTMLTTFGLQLDVVPQQLESGFFPCQLIPTAEVGVNTGLQLTLGDRRSDEPIISPSVTNDSTDQCHRLMGQSGIQQMAANIAGDVIDTGPYEPGTQSTPPLFVSEGWSDHNEVTGTGIDLLGALLAGELSLRTEPWQNITGAPRGIPRWAQYWPMTGELARVEWNPGDSLFLNLPEIGVVDEAPRQLMQVTETFNPNGLEGMTVQFRQRPMNPTTRLAKILTGHSRSVRSQTPSIVTANGPFTTESLAIGSSSPTYGAACYVALNPGDIVRRAYIVIALNGSQASNNPPPGGTLDVYMQNSAACGFTFNSASGSVDVTRWSQSGHNLGYLNRIQYAIKNSGPACVVQHQLFVEIVR